MRSITLVVPACVLIASATRASADEPAGRAEVAFVDSPAIVNSRPLRVDSWSRTVGDNEEALDLHFTVGSPACTGVHATVHETDGSVAVGLRSGALPEAVGRMCPMIAVFGVLEVRLQGPLDDRQVLI